MKSQNLFSLKGKVIILTGGAGFLGKNHAQVLSQAGAQVIIWDRYDDKTLGEALKDIPKSFKIDVQSVDITDEVAVVATVKKIVKKYGRIDTLINNAAMNPAVGSDESKKMFVPYDEYPISSFRKEIDVNIVGSMICTKAVAPIMKKQRVGVIINVASEVSNIAHDHRVYNDPENRKYKSPAYVTSKTALIGLTRQWAAYLGQYNVRVITFSPGTVHHSAMSKDFVDRFSKTNMFGRLAQANEHSAVILFLCSDASSFMTGTNVVADAGHSAW